LKFFEMNRKTSIRIKANAYFIDMWNIQKRGIVFVCKKEIYAFEIKKLIDFFQYFEWIG